MSEDSTQKYKHFRNYMTNELGVTRSDIEAWTKEAVANEVQKLVSGVSMKEIAAKQVEQAVRTAISSYGGMSNEMKKIVGQEVQDQIAGQIVVSIKSPS